MKHLYQIPRPNRPKHPWNLLCQWKTPRAFNLHVALWVSKDDVWIADRKQTGTAVPTLMHGNIKFDFPAVLTSITSPSGPKSPCHRDCWDCARGVVLWLWYMCMVCPDSHCYQPSVGTIHNGGIFKLAFCLSERKNGEVTLDYVAGKGPEGFHSCGE